MKVTEVKNVPVRTDNGGVSLFVRIETDAGIQYIPAQTKR